MKLVKTVKDFTKKNKPEILLIAGLGAVIFGTVKTVKAVEKDKELITEANAELEAIENKIAETANEEEIAELNGEKRKVYLKTIGKALFITAEGLLLIFVGGKCVYGAYKEQNNRIVAIAGAKEASDQFISAYRKRVAEKLGDEAEKELAYNLQKVKIEEETVDEETGKKKKTKRTELAIPDENYNLSPNAIILNESDLFKLCGSGCKDPLIVTRTLKGIENNIKRQLENETLTNRDIKRQFKVSKDICLSESDTWYGFKKGMAKDFNIGLFNNPFVIRLNQDLLDHSSPVEKNVIIDWGPGVYLG